jgi:hypothetical protein
MPTIDDLLLSYKQLNERMVKTQELNEKIFKEIIMKKVRSSTNTLLLFDILGWSCGSIILLFSIYSIFKSSDRLDMLIISILLLGFFCLLTYVYGKTIKWRLVSSSIVTDTDISSSIQQVKEYTQQLIKQRKLGIILVIPLLLLEIPVAWYIFYHRHYLEVLYSSWYHSRWYIYYVIGVIALTPVFTWKLYDWMYFPLLRKIEANLEEIKETN